MKQKGLTGQGNRISIRYTIFVYFTVSALAIILLIGAILYSQMSRQLALAVQEENRIVLSAHHYEVV